MIKLLVKLFIKDYNNTSNQNVREKYGVLGGVLGIICNVFLFVVKLTIGLIVNAFSIVSDAFNNLTDSLSSIISIISAKFSNKKPDKDHPFGHGRFEYVSTLIVSFIIMLVGFELAMTSITNFIDLIEDDSCEIIMNSDIFIPCFMDEINEGERIFPKEKYPIVIERDNIVELPTDEDREYFIQNWNCLWDK